MKFPSIFKTARPMSFDIKPRYYDPVKEEIDQRTQRIKRQLQADGKLKSDEEITDAFRSDYGSPIRGAFAQGGPIKGRQSSIVTSAGMLRLFIFMLLIGGMMGYIYFGSIVLYIVLYLSIGGGLAGLFFRLKASRRK
ncbi:hypothetical protein [Belliella pelovolcani]|uniref:Uncharacterized protein n=1 Tax=Belliella pelovolcani TaxID=529505 RepID=A0A1N7JJ32_9BACT|nr:hypothetical protein [Belliella pelovolcani]SIS49271.1 hypothetical protein SAMN05421761_10152 [Belliella pelovolcani]